MASFTTNNRLKHAAGLMLVAEDHNLKIHAENDGRIFISGEEASVYALKPEMCRFKTEISHLLNITKQEADAFIKRVMEIGRRRSA